MKPISRQKFERFLLHVDCDFVRQKGSHRIFWKEGCTRPVVVPARGTLTKSLIASNLRTLGVSVDQYLSIMNDL